MKRQHFRLGTVEEGARNAVGKVLGLKSNERIVIVSDLHTEDIGNAIAGAAEGMVGPNQVTRAYLEDFGERTGLHHVKAEDVLQQGSFKALISDIESSPAAVYMGKSQPLEGPIRGAIRRAGNANNGRHLHLPDIGGSDGL